MKALREFNRSSFVGVSTWRAAAIGGKGSRVAGRQRLAADPNKKARSRRVVVTEGLLQK
jgi:hypothetical protein